MRPEVGDWIRWEDPDDEEESNCSLDMAFVTKVNGEVVSVVTLEGTEAECLIDEVRVNRCFTCGKRRGDNKYCSNPFHLTLDQKRAAT